MASALLWGWLDRRDPAAWAVLVIEGDPLPVCGLTEITSMFKR